MDRTDFELLLKQAQKGDKEAIEELFGMYNPLLAKSAIYNNFFDEDLYQELCATLLYCIQKFK